MHYAEFAEDEVSNFVRLPRDPPFDVYADDEAECGIAAGYQGLREQQMEGHWPEGWQTGKGT